MSRTNICALLRSGGRIGKRSRPRVSGQGENRSLDGSATAQFSEAASCSLELWNFTRKCARNTMRRLTGILSAARTTKPPAQAKLGRGTLKMDRNAIAWATRQQVAFRNLIF